MSNYLDHLLLERRESIREVEKLIGWPASAHINSESRVINAEVKRIELDLGFKFPQDYLVFLEMQKYFGFSSFDLFSPKGIHELRKDLGIHNVPFCIKGNMLFVWPLYSGVRKNVFKIYDGESKMHLVAKSTIDWCGQFVIRL